MTDLFSSLSFGKLISHVFPGFLLIFSIFLLIDSFCIDPGFYTCQLFEKGNLEIFIIIVGIFLLVGTIIGIIIDGIQHISITVIFGFLYKNISKLPEHYFKIYSIISSTLLEDLLIKYKNIKTGNSIKSEINYLHSKNIYPLDWNLFLPLIDTEKYKIFNDEFYYYYEFFANIFLVLPITSFSILFYSYNVLNLSCILSLLFCFIIIFIALLCLYNSFRLYCICEKIRFNLLLGTIVEKEMRINSIASNISANKYKT